MTRIRARLRAPRKAKARPASRAARQLALAHHIERLIETGKLTDYAAAARALGITRARLTQVMKLLLLTPTMQGRILEGELEISERRMRIVVAQPDWTAQVRALESRDTVKKTTRRTFLSALAVLPFWGWAGKRDDESEDVSPQPSEELYTASYLTKLDGEPVQILAVDDSPEVAWERM